MRLFYLVMISTMLFVGCANESETEKNEVLVVYSPHSLEFIDPIISEFENETNIAVKIISAGTGELVNRIENESDSPQGDVLWGGSLSVLESKKTLFEPYISVNDEAAIYKNPDGYITRFTLMPSVIMVNTNLIGDMEIKGYSDLLHPDLIGRIAFADPSKSSSSYEQLLNQLWAFKDTSIEDGWTYVEALTKQFEGRLVESSRGVYTGVIEGEYFIGLTFETPAAQYVQNGAPIEVVYPEEGVIVRPDGVAIIKGAIHVDAAKAFVDYVTSYDVQKMIANELNRRSIRMDVEASQGLKSFEAMVIIEDDENWSSENKNLILERFNALMTVSAEESLGD